MKYYAVCYGHVCRFEKASTAAEACRLAFGLVDTDRMTVRTLPVNPIQLSFIKRKAFLEPLYKRHKEKTGSVIA